MWPRGGPGSGEKAPGVAPKGTWYSWSHHFWSLCDLGQTAFPLWACELRRITPFSQAVVNIKYRMCGKHTVKWKLCACVLRHTNGGSWCSERKRKHKHWCCNAQGRLQRTVLKKKMNRAEDRKREEETWPPRPTGRHACPPCDAGAQERRLWELWGPVSFPNPGGLRKSMKCLGTSNWKKKLIERKWHPVK